VQEQTAVNAARHRLGVPLRFLDRRYSWSLFGHGNSYCEAAVITGHYNNGELRSNFAAVCDTLSAGEVDEAAFARLGDRYYRYSRVGYDERPLLLRRDGTIGSGGGDAERFWFVRQSGDERMLVIGSETKVTCALHPDADGVWRGRWVDYERMPIEFAPHRGQVLLDLLETGTGADQECGCPSQRVAGRETGTGSDQDDRCPSQRLAGRETGTGSDQDDRCLSRFRARALAGAEIGVFEGHTSALLLRELPQLRLWMVDRWAAPQPGERYWQDPYMRGVPQAQMDRALHTALRATDFARDRRVVLIGDLVTAAAGMADGTLDFVFCDADHCAEGTLEAIETWWPKLRPGGLMAGHDLDYPGFPGVREAVEETARRRKLPWNQGHDYVWYFRVPT
jgi:Methyltransferase domain